MRLQKIEPCCTISITAMVNLFKRWAEGKESASVGPSCRLKLDYVQKWRFSSLYQVFGTMMGQRTYGRSTKHVIIKQFTDNLSRR